MPDIPTVILGVAGGTGSGKTTVARAILEAVGPKRLAFIAQDSYYRQIEWDSPEHLASHNFDHPSSIDTELLVSHLFRPLGFGQQLGRRLHQTPQAERVEDVYPQDAPQADSELIRERPVWRLEGGRAVLVGYRIFGVPGKSEGRLQGVTPRREYVSVASTTS